MLRIVIPLIIAYLLITSITFGGSRSVFESQQQRIFMYSHVLERQTHRLEGYRVLLHAWRDNPIFGKGITPSLVGKKPDIGDIGGHGAYFSLLGLFGLFGLAFILLVLVYPLYNGVRHLINLRKGVYYDHTILLSRLFSLMLVFLTVIYAIGGTGYADPSLFLTSGFLVALLERQQRKSSSML